MRWKSPGGKEQMNQKDRSQQIHLHIHQRNSCFKINNYTKQIRRILYRTYRAETEWKKEGRKTEKCSALHLFRCKYRLIIQLQNQGALIIRAASHLFAVLGVVAAVVRAVVRAERHGIGIPVPVPCEGVCGRKFLHSLVLLPLHRWWVGLQMDCR